MAKVRIFEAATEGFRLIRREPKAVLVWGVALFVLMGLPMALYLKGFSTAFLQMGEFETDEAALRAMGPLFASLPLLILGSIAGYTVVGGAVLRAVIDPDDRRRLYIRLSKAELWLVLSAVVGCIIAYVAALLVVLVTALAGAVMGALAGLAVQGHAMSGAHWGMIAGIAVGEIAIYFGMLRFSMAPLMSFDERRFRLFEAWRYTRGEGWRLVGLVLVQTLALFVVELLLLIPAIGLSSLFWPAMAGDLTAAEGFVRGMGLFYASPWMWLVMAVGAVLGGAFMALLIAPWARAYLMLKADITATADSDLSLAPV